jgi:retinol dehydrogenase-12
MIAQLRKLIFRKPLTPVQSLAGRKFIVTGCAENSIGYATAKTLLEWGAEVTISRRRGTEALLENLKMDVAESAERLFGHDLDIADAKSVKIFANWYKAERKALDVLINNAGIHLDLMSKWKKPRLSDDNHEIQWRTNYLGTTHLSHALIPLLEQSAESTGDARIVNVISMLHSKGSNSEFFEPSKPYNSWSAYGQSKLGLIHFTKALQERFSNKGLSAYCLHPGEVYTNVAGKGLAGNPLIEAVRNFFWPVEKFMLMTPFEGAQTSLLCATSPDVRGGEYYRNCEIAEASADANDKGISDQLWKTNLKWVGQL